MSALSDKNRCVPVQPALGVCPQYICQCNGNGFVAAGSDRQACKYCPDPCALDPCNAKLNDKNICVPIAAKEGTVCPTYRCDCAEGFFLQANSCSRCPLPCLTKDPCKVAQGNQCTVAPPSVSLDNMLQLRSHTPGVMAIGVILEKEKASTSVCPQPVCTCSVPGYMEGPKSASCVPCNPCLRNTCASRGTKNLCLLGFPPTTNGVGGERGRNLVDAILDDEECGEFQCKCDEPGYLRSADGKRCLDCNNPCASDPCNSNEGINQCLQVQGKPE